MGDVQQAYQGKEEIIKILRFGMDMEFARGWDVDYEV